MENNFGRENFGAESGAENEMQVEEQQGNDAAEGRELIEREETPEEAAETIAIMRTQLEGLNSRLAELEAEKADLKQMSPEAESFARMQEIDAEIADCNEQIAGMEEIEGGLKEQGENAVITIKE